MKNYRLDFPFLKRQYQNKDVVYFDNASTALKPSFVLDAVSDYYQLHNANVGRGVNFLAEEATALYEEARSRVASFIGAKSKEIIFTSGSTASLNFVAKSFAEKNLKTGDVVAISRAEHHANILPWLQLKEKIGIIVEYIDLDENGDFSLTSLNKIFNNQRLKILSLTQASNVLGKYYDLKEIIKRANDLGIITVVDASQSISHRELAVKDLGVDFLVFSGHKILAPTGIGVLYVKEEIINNLDIFLSGGGMINEVKAQSFSLAEIPYRFEAGTPNISGAIGLGAACKYLQSIGWREINRREEELRNYFLEKLALYPELQLLGTNTNRLLLFSFKLTSMHPHDIADLLSDRGVVVSSGYHCAQPLHDYLKIESSLRLSLAFYNTKEEIDYFFNSFSEVRKIFI